MGGAGNHNRGGPSATTASLPRGMRRGATSPLLWILAVALLARVVVLIATPDFTPIFDAADYPRPGASIAAGDGYPASRLEPGSPTAFRPPFYPVTLAVVQKLGGGWTAE